MSSAKSHIQTIVSTVETLGYTFTDEFFDMDNYPTSGSNKLYRIESKTAEVTGISGNRVEKRKEFTLWIAFKLVVASDRKQDTYNVVDAKETLEDDIFKAFSGVQVRLLENQQSAIKDDYILVKLTGDFIYWRDLT